MVATATEMHGASPSVRSLRSLQLVPPPPKKNSDVEKWDPFPAPYAPHVEEDELRDGQEARLSPSDELCQRDTGEEWEAPPKAPLGTPPRSPLVRHSDTYYSNERQSIESSRRRSNLIKVSANGSVAGEKEKPKRRSLSRSRGDNDQKILSSPQTSSSYSQPLPSAKKFSPILTKGRIQQHETEEQLGSRRGEAKRSTVEGQDSSRIMPATSSQPTSYNQKMCMVGTSKIYSRTLISPTVYHNAATDLWIVTINSTSKLANNISKGSGRGNNKDSVKAFSFRTEKEARASAYANAPPEMIPFESCKECMLCDAKFTMFTRPRHCRNCGICICSNYACSTVWPKSMIPETFNFKKESTVKVCTSCNSLTKRFQNALLNGRYGTGVELFLTGNINLRVPFVFKGGKKDKESMFPMHCAIEGESEKLVRWLVGVQHCPLHVISTGNTKGSSFIGSGMIKSINETLGSTSEKKVDFVPTLKTSKGRSIIDVAMKTQHVGILRYLINEKKVSVYEVEDLELALGAVDALANAFPSVDGTFDPKLFKDKGGEEKNVSDKVARSGNAENSHRSALGKKSPAVNKSSRRGNAAIASPSKERIHSHSVVLAPPTKSKMVLPSDIHGQGRAGGLYGVIGGYDGNSDSSTTDGEPDTIVLDDDDDNSVCTTVPEVCILCEEKDVDCVATPCGHQMCCLSCSNQCLRCPICNLECHFIEIYQP